MNRRDFLEGLVSAGTATLAVGTESIGSSAELVAAQSLSSTVADRDFWLSVVRRLADPVLNNLAAGTLKARMPLEQAAGADRRSVTHLEAFGRLLAGIAPWLELQNHEVRLTPDTTRDVRLTPATTDESSLRAHYADLAHRAMARALDPASPDLLNFTHDRQPLVDAAFLAQGLLRAPRTLRDGLDGTTKSRLIAALESTRIIPPGFNNWLLFSATIEAALKSLGAGWDRVRVDYALRQHEQWYKGDGVYGDGPSFHWDYYNSFVIHPMMLDVLDGCRDEMPAWSDLAARELERARRYAAIQERSIAPDGSFPPIGRSIAYRFGAFHLLAQMALRRTLPEGIAPAQVRSALTAVIRRTLAAPDTFDGDGWLRIGFCGHQPGIGETYISTGSLYLCAVGLLPLGLPSADEFWTAPALPWTSVKAWSGEAFAIDHSL
jgi:hypothetical protein